MKKRINYCYRKMLTKAIPFSYISSLMKWGIKSTSKIIIEDGDKQNFPQAALTDFHFQIKRIFGMWLHWLSFAGKQEFADSPWIIFSFSLFSKVKDSIEKLYKTDLKYWKYMQR
jgi:hypothetical protein